MKDIFVIEHIDPLGQGVSRLDGKVTFIAKTLPDEKGQAKILRAAKGVRFAVLENEKDLTAVSPLRHPSPCPHFSQCNGCHFLHTNYSFELDCKKKSFLHQSRILEKNGGILPELTLHPANRRLGYRNRIQLHYDLRLRQIGFIDTVYNTILSVPSCKIPLPAIQKKLTELYQNGEWEKLLAGEKTQGHLELFLRQNGEVEIAINRPYSHGGFQQVNSEENDKLLHLIEQLAQQVPEGDIIDLFGGKGNLSMKLAPRSTVVIDSSPYSLSDMASHQRYQQLNLYGADALAQLERIVPQKPELLIIDPPRSGFKELSALCDAIEPKCIFYVSCNLSSQLRDLAPLMKSYDISQIHLFDFFPSTYHFESLIVLSKKN